MASARDHSLDALRAAMMLLGLVLHSAASYTVNPLREVWPFRDAQAHIGFDLLIFGIHVFRMPVFFVMAGFFGALLYRRDGAWGFVHNRARRVLLPLVLFWALVIPLVALGFLFAVGQAAGDTGLVGLPQGSILREPILGHLWFLYNLLFYYAAAVMVVPIASRLSASVRARAHTAFRSIATSAWGTVALAGATLLSILPGSEPGIGLSASLIPRLHVLAAYGVFFAFGWLLHAHREALDVYAARWKATAVAAAVASGLYLYVLAAQPIDDPRLWTVASMALCALATWPLVFAITGLFVRHMRTPRPIVRYFSDAAYWMYLVHLPLTVWIPGLLARSPLPAAAKFAVVLAATTLVTTVTYNYLVRPTVVGVLLNGRRYPRGLPGPAPRGQQVLV
ncbi:MAG: acyltransferase family protein [Vicinamibacterales bacterium]